MEYKKKTYYYPSFAPSWIQVKGLVLNEWIICAVSAILPLLLFEIPGLLIGAMIAGAEWLLLYRKEGERINTLNQMILSIRYKTSQQIFIKKEREELQLMNEDKSSAENKKKKPKKQSKKNRRKKEKNMQEFFSFKKISDSLIEMEDGSYYIFLKINANHLNFLSFKEIDAVMTELSKQMDRCQMLPDFFIQDNTFSIKENIAAIKKAGESSKSQFIKNLGSDACEIIKENKKTVVKKSAYVFVKTDQKMLKNKSITELKGKLRSAFKNTLNVDDVSSEELKQILAVYANRIFSDNFPDTEMELEAEEQEKKLIRKKHKTYESIQLPGIYEFKDMITPVTALFRPSDGTVGSNLVKTYAVSSFLAATDDTNILSKISSLKGITTTIRLEQLPMYKFKSNIKSQMKSKNANIDDEIDAIDNDLEKETTKSGYKRAKATKQRMYYVSILFQLTAKTREELSLLEDQFSEKCSDVSLQVDPLQTMQRLGYESANPIGRNSLAKWVKQNIPSESVANLYPFEDTSLLDPEGMPIGTVVDKDDQMLFNSFTDRGTNNNMLILGVSGIGKTILMMLLLQNEAIMGTYIRNIDVEGTYVKFIERLGGINIDMAGNNEYCINPLHIRIPDEIHAGIVDDYVSEVKNFMSIYKSSWSDRLLDLFEHYTRAVYTRKNITNTTDLTKLKAKDMPLFSDIYDLIQHDRDNYSELTMLATPQDLNDLLLGMDSMVKGADAKLFNRYTFLGDLGESGLENQIINFDLSSMMNSALSRRLAQWSNIFKYNSQFVNNNMDRSKKIMVSVDELQHFFKVQYLAIMEIIESYERRFRKYKASFIKASQTIEEFNSENAALKDSIKTLFSQPAVKFIFHLGDIDYKVTKDLLNLKDIEINTLKEKRNGKCLMRVNDTVYDLDVLMPVWFSEVKKDA